ncbi:MAG TPA: hypothetical protein VD866_22225 [Urbifossiella sp.]|nr:hypothetical protein [Urbifossiella sp.]
MTLALTCFLFLALVSVAVTNTGPELRIGPDGRVRFIPQPRKK